MKDNDALYRFWKEATKSETLKAAGSDGKVKTLTHLASERSLATTWDNRKEDKAWEDL